MSKIKAIKRYSVMGLLIATTCLTIELNAMNPKSNIRQPINPNRQLIKGVERNQPNEVQEALDRDANVNSVASWRGMTPLWEASMKYVYAQNEESENSADQIVALLLEKGADVEVAYAEETKQRKPYPKETLLNKILNELVTTHSTSWKVSKPRKERMQKLTIRLIQAGAQLSPDVAEALAKKEPQVSKAVMQALEQPGLIDVEPGQAMQPPIESVPVPAAPSDAPGKSSRVKKIMRQEKDRPAAYQPPALPAPTRRIRRSPQEQAPAPRSLKTIKALAQESPSEFTPQTPTTFIQPEKRTQRKPLYLNAELQQLNDRTNYLEQALDILREQPESSLENVEKIKQDANNIFTRVMEIKQLLAYNLLSLEDRKSTTQILARLATVQSVASSIIEHQRLLQMPQADVSEEKEGDQDDYALPTSF